MNKKFTLLIVALLAATQILVAQTLSGKIEDSDGKPISGAIILEKGTTNGTHSGFNGGFKMKTPANGSTLKISCIGYQTLEMGYNGQGTLQVKLESKMTQGKEVQIVGSRNTKRTVLETAVPVDIINVSKTSQSMGQVDVNQILQYTAPSFNTNKQSGSDGSDHVMPATLRGMGPDQTLVLLNGKRYHQSALVNLYGTRGRGNTGTDLNTIPATAIERIEILRDGASAQYGSDAIAGVMNIILKKSTGRLTGSLGLGANYTGYGSSLNTAFGNAIPSTFDGEQASLGLNYGVDIKNGYLNMTLEGQFKNKTLRPNFAPLYSESYREKSGDPSYQNFSFFTNFSKQLSEKIELYANLGVGMRNGSSYAWTRTADDSRNIPSIYPNGFNPDIKANILDAQTTVGLKTTLNNIDFDIYANYGFNQFKYDVHNTLNTSLGATSPTQFYSGGFSLDQKLVGISASKNYDNVLSGFNLAGGIEGRMERYIMMAGDSNSYFQYSDAAPGAQGFPGFQPRDASNNSRSNVGAFLDAEIDITKKWMVSTAIRVENYSDFGFTPNFKFATRYKLTDNAILRGAISTGFRAPSLAQLYFSSTFTNVAAGVIQDQVLAPNNSDLAKLMNIPTLKQETSVNGSLGIALKPEKDFSLTIDGYMVKVKDRIVLTGVFSSDIPEISSILSARNVTGVQFFTNAANTTTMGLDIVASKTNINIFKGNHTLTFAANLNKMTIDEIYTNQLLSNYSETYFGPREKAFLLASAPSHKLSLNFDQKWEKIALNLRFTHYSSVILRDWNNDINLYKSRLVTDLSASFNVTNNLLWTLGCNNLFDVYPTLQNPGYTEGGGMWDAVQNGNSGAFFYTKVGFKF
jgi:iron complex outermembrane receptor protein